MISKLPRWVWTGGGVLAFSAGMINAIAFLGFSHQGVTHVTGIFSHLSIGIFQHDGAAALHPLCMILSFFAGAVLSGVILRDSHLQMGRRYGVALSAECMLLLISTYGFWRMSPAGDYFAAMAAGLQNALVSMYSGAIVRTTHLTGLLTDLGVLTGHWLQGIRIDSRRVRLFLILIFSFTAGGVAGAFFFGWWENIAMLVPALLIGASAGVYEFLRKHNTLKGPETDASS